MSRPARRRAAPLLATLLAALPAGAEQLELQVRADVMEADEAGNLTAQGDVRVRSGTLFLRAPRLAWDRDKGRALLDGGVLAVDGPRLLTAPSLVLEAGALQVGEGRLVVKKGVDGPTLLDLAARDPAAARKAGRDSLVVRARLIERLDGELYSARGLWLTTCACGDDCRRPLLAVSASSARVRPGESALLFWPVLRLFGLPLPLLVPISLPLTDRRTGVLVPRFSSGPTGFTTELPLFLTLGDPADLTLRPRYAFGPDRKVFPDRGLGGWGAEAELRWRPRWDARGLLRGAWHRDDEPARQGVGGNRGEIAGLHAQELLGGRLAADVRAVSDTAVLYDTYAPNETAFLPYLRSRAGWWRQGALGVAALDATAIQSLCGAGKCANDERVAAGRSFGVLAPLPRLTLEGSRALGPLLVDGLAESAWWTSPSQAGRAAGREPRITAGLSLGQVLPVASGRGGALALEAGERLEWLAGRGEAGAGGEERLRLGVFAGARASTRLARTFAGGWIHEIVPSAAVRGFWSAGRPFRATPFDAAAGAGAEPLPLTLWDIAQPPGATAQAVVRLSTALVRQGFTPVQLFAEHHQTLRPWGAGQLVLGLSQGFEKWLGGARLTLDAQLEPGGDEPVVLARGTWSGRLGPLGVGVSGTHARKRSDQFAAGPDALFGVPGEQAGQPDEPVQSGDAWASWSATSGPLRGLTLVARVEYTRDRAVNPQYGLAVTYDAGGCAVLRFAFLWNRQNPRHPTRPDPVPSFGFSFELGELDAAGLAAAPVLGRPGEAPAQ